MDGPKLLRWCSKALAVEGITLDYSPRVQEPKHEEGNDNSFLMCSNFTKESGLEPRAVYRNLPVAELYEKVSQGRYPLISMLENIENSKGFLELPQGACLMLLVRGPTASHPNSLLTRHQLRQQPVPIPTRRH